MSIVNARIRFIVAQRIGNVMRNEGMENSQSIIECSSQTKKYLGRLLVKLSEKSSPYTSDATTFPILEKFSKSIIDQDQQIYQSSLLATRLYETGRHLQIEEFTFLNISFETQNSDATSVVRGIALIAFSSPKTQISYDEKNHHMDNVETINEDSLDRVAIWHENSDIIRIIERKSIPNKFWINDFLCIKPVLTENKAAAMAYKLIKKISSEIDSSIKSSEYRDKVKHLVDASPLISFNEIDECSSDFLDRERVNAIKKNIEKQGKLFLEKEYEFPSQILYKKVNQFIKTLRVTPNLDITIKGNQEVLSMEQLRSDEEDTIIIKLKIKEEE